MADSHNTPKYKVGDKLQVEIEITEIDSYGYYLANVTTSPWFVGESGCVEAVVDRVT